MSGVSCYLGVLVRSHALIKYVLFSWEQCNSSASMSRRSLHNSVKKKLVRFMNFFLHKANNNRTVNGEV